MDGMITPGIIDKLLTMPETLVHLVVVLLMYKIIVLLITKDKDKQQK